MRAKSISGYLAVTAITLCTSPAVHAQPSSPAGAALRAGAARIDYTPRDAQLPRNFTGVLDPIFVRALVLDNGSTRAALVAVDAGAIPGDLYDKVSTRAAAELRDSGQPAADFRKSYAQRSVPPRRRRRGNDSARPARLDLTAAAGTGGVGHGRLVHQREPRPHRSKDPALVGRPELRRPVRQDRGSSPRRDAGRLADRGLLQLRRARRDHRHARHDQRRHSGSGIALRRGVPRRRRSRALCERRGRRPEPDLFQSDV